MSKQKLTDWFPSAIKPARVGYYHTKANEEQVEESPWNWWWTGRTWRASPDGIRATVQDRVWRGLSEKTA